MQIVKQCSVCHALMTEHSVSARLMACRDTQHKALMISNGRGVATGNKGAEKDE